MTRLNTFLQTHPKEVVGVLLVLFLILLALSIWAWNPPHPKDSSFAALRGKVLDLQSPNVYPLDTLATPSTNFSTSRTVPLIVHRCVENEDDISHLPDLLHLENWNFQVYTTQQRYTFVRHNFGGYPDILHAYNLCRLPQLQCDLFKYLVIYKLGGLYLNNNAIITKPLGGVTNSVKPLVSCFDPPRHVDMFGNMTQGVGEYQTWWVMAPPHSEFLWRVVWQIVRNVFFIHTTSLHNVPFFKGNFSQLDLITGGICYTYVASLYPHTVTICKCDFAEMRDIPTRDLTTTQSRVLPVHLVYVQNRTPSVAHKEKHLIPAIIHQTNETRWVTPAMAHTVKQICEHAPTCEYRFYDSQERRAFIKEHYSCALNAYDALVPGAFRADLFRMIVVYTHGGTYIDMGMTPYEHTSLYEHVLEESDEFVIPIDVLPYGLSNGFFAATAKHPYLKLIISHILDNITNRRTFASHPYGMYSVSGPRACEEALRNELHFPLTEGKYANNLRLIQYSVGRHPGVSKLGAMLYKRKYDAYYEDQQLLNNDAPHYSLLWKLGNIYHFQSDLDYLLQQPIKYLPFDLPVFYINMDKSIDRNESVLKELRAVSQNITRVPAIDGTDSKKVTLVSDFNNLTRGEIGCTASHLKAINFAYTMNVERALICEDDVSFLPLRVWQQNALDSFFTSISDDVGIVLLCWGGKEYETELRVSHIRTLGSLFGTVAYVITRKGMTDILRHACVSDAKIHLRASEQTPIGNADGYLYGLTTLATSGVPLALADNSIHKTAIKDRVGGDHDVMQHEWFVKSVNKLYHVAIHQANKASIKSQPECKQVFNLSRALQYIKTRPTLEWLQTIPVLYINLDRSPERRATIEAQLRSVKVLGERVSGFDGRKIDDRTHTIDGVSISCDFTGLTPCELGCTASHLKAIKRAFEMNVDKVLICEDDVSFESMGVWPQDMVHKFLYSIPDDIGIVLLYWGGYAYKHDLLLSALPPSNDAFSTCAYIITRHGMQNVLAQTSVSHSHIHWPKTQVHQNDQADKYLFSLTTVATSGVPLLLADNISHKSVIDDRAQNHDSYQFEDFVKAVQAINTAACGAASS